MNFEKFKKINFQRIKKNVQKQKTKKRFKKI